MKLIVQIPCFNERDYLASTVADLPRSIPGIDCIEVMVIDDGSIDDTAEVAREIGVHHLLRIKENRGLANAFTTGLDAALRLGADIIVNTDADNQYCGQDIARLVVPILEGQADVVVGDRQTNTIAHFSPLKRLLQRWGSRLVRTVSATNVADSTSGFRAFTRNAAERLFVHNRFTYTLETLIQAGRAGLVVKNVVVGTNPKNRNSRLFRSVPDYLRRAGPVIFRAYIMYRPVQTFALLALMFLSIGVGLVGRFIFFWIINPAYSGYTQSLTIGVGCVVLSFLIGIVTLLGELLAANRRLLEETLCRVRRLESRLTAGGDTLGIHEYQRTTAAPWKSE